MNPDDLIAFLRDRLTEDERTARAVDWPGSGNSLSWMLPASATVDVGEVDFYAEDRTIANHIVTWDPIRVLAEVSAKRQALEHYQAVRNHARNNVDAYVLAEGAVAKQIQIAALPYADHPDYRQEWKP